MSFEMEDKKVTVESEELAYEKNRLNEFNKLAHFNPYPHKFGITITFEEYIAKYSNVETSSRHIEFNECVAGRILEKRNSGKKLFFYTVTSNGFTLQYLADIREYENKEKFLEMNNLIHRGDIVGVRGFVGKSLKGELSIYPLELVLLTPCYKYLPKQVFGITDIDTRIKKRHLDMIANPNVIKTFKIRSQVIKEIRNYLDLKGFIEIDTPILNTKFGGAVAKPFITYHNDLKNEMFMRIAPELHLKQLVIGGLDRVYEIGKQFRNENLDSSHQAEFQSIEFYMTYVDYYDLMGMVEELISGLAIKINGSYSLTYADKTLNFAIPFKRIHILDELKKQTNETFDFDNFTTNEFSEFLDDLCIKHQVECGAPRTIARMFDKLIGHFIEPQCANPTFLTNHPLVMSPLAKCDRDDFRLSERFELFVNGMELSNAYTELNNHIIQEMAFRSQQKDKGMGDEEIPLPDDDFIDALKYGLPPTGGCGIGIDRLIMFLTNHQSIREVITFPL